MATDEDIEDTACLITLIPNSNEVNLVLRIVFNQLPNSYQSDILKRLKRLLPVKGFLYYLIRKQVGKRFYKLLMFFIKA